jgi:AraC-like DNA-binding protein
MLAGIGRDPAIESDFVYRSLPASLNLMRTKTVLVSIGRPAIVRAWHGTPPLSEIAFAAGFRSIRRFNDAFRATYGRPPSSFRRTAI